MQNKVQEDIHLNKDLIITVNVNVDLNVVLKTLLNVTELENLEQGIEKLRRAPEKDLEKLASETLPGMTPSPAVRAYLEEMEVQFAVKIFLDFSIFIHLNPIQPICIVAYGL